MADVLTFASPPISYSTHESFHQNSNNPLKFPRNPRFWNKGFPSTSNSSDSEGCSNYAQGLTVFMEKIREGSRPNGFALASLVQASSAVYECRLGVQLHGWVIRAGFATDIGIRKSLISMYLCFGMLRQVNRLFNEVSLEAYLTDGRFLPGIMDAYNYHGYYYEAMKLFLAIILVDSVRPVQLPYVVSVIKACSLAGEEDFGMAVHGRIVKAGMLVAETGLLNSLISFYGKQGKLDEAGSLFDRIPCKDVVSWNSIIAAYEQNGKGEIAISLFCRMLPEEITVQPNRLTFLSIISAVSSLADIKVAKETHAHIIRLGFEVDMGIVNSLITMYSRCKKVIEAALIFERADSKDLISWNSMLSAYKQNKLPDSCFKLFGRMLLSGIVPDSHSFTIILSVASSESSDEKHFLRTREIHGYIVRGSLNDEMNLPVSNALIRAYGNNLNGVSYAEKVFARMRGRDSYSWNAMMVVYSQCSWHEDAFMIFTEMLNLDLPIDHFSYSAILTSCGRSASLNQGKQLHAAVLKNQYAQQDENYHLLSMNSLISMYSRCGCINDASCVFSKMDRRDIFSWTAMITGFGEHGMGSESLQLFDKMGENDIRPNEVTFLGLLMACSHGGLLKKGFDYFEAMSKVYGLCPAIEHYACMVDLFGRAGQLTSAKHYVELGISQMKPSSADTAKLEKVLLSACHAHKELKLGVEAAARIMLLAPEDKETYVLLSNTYASSGLWEEASKIRAMMTEKCLRKDVGCSWVDLNNQRHTFVSGDLHHSRRKEIYQKLEELDSRIREAGYNPRTEFVHHDVDKEQKELILRGHSEKLAVSFTLLQQREHGRVGIIRVMKNMRICGDCHEWMKFVSRTEEAWIILRDNCRFHSFSDGRCSCGDFW